jgi:hypothetical protein
MPSRKRGLLEYVGLNALFPKDNPPPRAFAQRSLNIQHWNEMPRGGHFAALEEPTLLAEDLPAGLLPSFALIMGMRASDAHK